MSVKGLTLTEEEVSQELDLNKLTGVDVSQDPELVLEMAQAVIDYSVQRTLGGLGVGRKAMPSPYSDEYADSLDFKAAGKSKTDVNLKLSGGMLDSVDLIETNQSVIKFGIQGEEAVKAFAHQTGFQGHPTIKGAKKRPFIGVTEAEFKEQILPKFKKDLDNIQNTQSRSQIPGILDQLRSVRNLFGEEPSLTATLFRQFRQISAGEE